MHSVVLLPPTQAELEELGEAEARSKVKKFLSTEGSIVSRPVNPFVPSGDRKEGESVFLSVHHAMEYICTFVYMVEIEGGGV